MPDQHLPSSSDSSPPTNYRERSNSEKQQKRNELLKLSLLNSQQSPFKKDFHSEEAKKFMQNFSKNSSSPTNSESFEDLNSINPEWIDSSFDRDLEDMKLNFKVEPMEQETEVFDESKVKIEPEDPVKPEKVQIKAEPMEIQGEDKNLENLLCNLKQAISNAKNPKAAEMIDDLEKMLANKEDKSLNLSGNNTDTNHLTVPVPNPIVRQDTFDIDERNIDDMKTPPRNPSSADVGPAQLPTDIVEQISKLLSTSNISVLQHNNSEQTDQKASHNQPTYIVVVPGASTPQVPRNMLENQNQSMRVRRSFSLSMDKKPTSLAKKDFSETPGKPRVSALSRRSSFSSPHVVGSARKTLGAVENSPGPSKSHHGPPAPRYIGRRVSLAPQSMRITENVESRNLSIRPKHGIMKKTSPGRRPGPIKAIPMPQISHQAAKTAVPANSRMQGNFVSRLMPKSPSLINKNNKRLSFLSSVTPQPVKSQVPQLTANSRVRSLSVGKKQLLGEY